MKFNLNKIIGISVIALIAIILLVGGFTLVKKQSFSWLSSKLNSEGTLPSYKHEVSANGWDFRNYTYVDPAGRICTFAVTDEKSGFDCDFPPVGFDMATFKKNMR